MSEKPFEVGMKVFGKVGYRVGSVQRVDRNAILVDIGEGKGILVPFEDAHVQNGKVRLNVPAELIEWQGWPYELLNGQGNNRENA